MPRIFNAGKFEEKLSSLTRSKDSIQNTSMWIIHHKIHCNEIVNEWVKAFKNSDSSYRLTLFYVANDVLQHCKKKGAPEFREAFAKVFEGVVGLASNEKIKSEIIRMIGIWNKRGVYSTVFLKKLQSCVEGTSIEHQKVQGSVEKTLDVDPNVVANFRLKDFITSLRKFSEFQKELQNKWDSVLSLDDIEIPELSSLPSATHSQALRLCGQMETMCVPVQNCLEIAEQDASRRQNIIKQLEESKAYYDIQNSEVEKVVHAYKVFGRKIKRLKKVLNEKTCAIMNASHTGTSVPSPSMLMPQSSSNDEDLQSSSLDKRLLSIFQESAVLGSQLETHDDTATLHDAENVVDENEEMDIGNISSENKPLQLIHEGSIPHNYKCDEQMRVDDVDMKEQNQNLYKSEEIKSDSTENVVETLSVSQSSESQDLTLNNQSCSMQSVMNTMDSASVPFSYVFTDQSCHSDNVESVEKPQSLNNVKPALSSSPVKIKSSDFSLPLTAVSSNIISVDESSKAINCSQNICSVFRNKEVLKSITGNNVDVIDSPVKLLLKSANILKNRTAQSSESKRKSTVLQTPTIPCTMPLNSLLSIIFHHPNVSGQTAHNNWSGVDVKNSPKLCNENSDFSAINDVNELQNYLLSVMQRKNYPVSLDSQQQFECKDSFHHQKEHSGEDFCSEDSGILNNMELQNFIAANIHHAGFQSLLNLLSSKSNEPKVEAHPVSCSITSTCNENSTPKINEKLSSGNPNTYGRLDNDSIQTTLKGEENHAATEVHDKNLEIMDMDVDSSDSEAGK